MGELHVSGAGVAAGYLHAPAPRRSFVVDPFRSYAGGRMYRTGDLVSVDADGLFHFVGRADDQIKVRGFRVEPAEVERCLMAHPRIREAAVVQRKLADDMDGLVAHVVADGAITDAELSRHARASLPGHMVPSRFVSMEKLPLTPSGKIDRRALAARDLQPASGDFGVGLPLAELVREVWQRVLGHDEFEPQDDFFDIGGDSLLAAWAVAEIGQAVGREIELSLLLRNSTVADLIAALQARTSSPATPVRAPKLSRCARAFNHPLFLLHPLGGGLLAYRELGARSVHRSASSVALAVRRR